MLTPEGTGELRRVRHVALRATPLLPVLVCVALSGGCVEPRDADPARHSASVGTAVQVNPERGVYFGDLHVHTMLSMDAYYLFGTRLSPEDAYRFARGEEITYMGEPIRRRQPLDFMAVTDHAQIIGSGLAMEDPESALAMSELGQRFLSGPRRGFRGGAGIQVWRAQEAGEIPGFDVGPVSRSAWTRIIEAANHYYAPGTFTTFIGYEWTTDVSTSGGSGGPIHRNVIFRGDTAPLPFSSLDSQEPEDLWTYLEEHRSRGTEGLIIPHNANMSNGVMYDWTDSQGRPIDETYARRRLLNEPISEIAQMKGQSEVHPALAPNDEFANFELFDMTFAGRPSQPEGSTIRDAYGRGLVIEERTGVNPYKVGVIGASDYHSGLTEEGEDVVYGSKSFNGVPPAAEAAVPREHVEGMFGLGEPEIPAGGTATGSGGLAGVWAEANTREAIYDALRRKETFATSGTRLTVRFFGGWDYADDLSTQTAWVRTAYAGGVPMGGDLPTRPDGGGAPQFAVWAGKDPNGANLDRAQVVKVWRDGDGYRDQVFDVALSDGRAPDPATGAVPPVGNTVDLATATYTNTVGATQLATVWEDPDFDPAVPAVYYLRVIEIPTPRWSTFVALKFGWPHPTDKPATIQERAWSSAIWYVPPSEES